MFEVAELGRKVSKKTYADKEPAFRTALLAAQGRLRQPAFPVISIVGGVEGAGKGEVVNELNRWLDARGVETHAFWDKSDEENERPKFWRFWRKLPPKSTVGIMFGSWYSEPIIKRAHRELTRAEFDNELQEISHFERLLSDEGALIVKFWLHLTAKTQQKRLQRDRKDGRNSPLLKAYAKHYERFKSASELTIRATNSDFSPWHIVESEDRRHRNLVVGETLLSAIEQRLEPPVPSISGPDPGDSHVADIPQAQTSILDQVDLNSKLDRATYDKRLAAAQNRLRNLAWRAYENRINTVCMFEGWDAAGKGGAIRRITAAIDARLFRVISIAAPSEEEHARHYLWRFWRQLPRAGYCTIYDRSWYGRVLVERVEGFCQQHEWSRAYHEINDFEQQLVDDGTVVLKFWLHISPEEQLRRFEDRQRTPWKQHKITDEDWRNRDRWPAYKAAVNEVVTRTSTDYAPWTIVPSNDKWFARVNVVETCCEQLEAALG
jgi:polyphosphate:AMP phosphotransferase